MGRSAKPFFAGSNPAVESLTDKKQTSYDTYTCIGNSSCCSSPNSIKRFPCEMTDKYTVSELHDGFYQFRAADGYHFVGAFGQNFGGTIYDVVPVLQKGIIIVKNS